MIMISEIKDYVQNNYSILFKTSKTESLEAVFDNRGFWFDDSTKLIYDGIKSQPHLYVAFTKSGFYYIGKSNQQGGRWKRQHAYHLGTLAYHLLDTIRYDDQNHLHWIEAWMDIDSLVLNNLFNAINLKETVYISFIPFSLYSNLSSFNSKKSLPPKETIFQFNKKIEASLISSYLNDGKTLLNIQRANTNKKPRSNNIKPTDSFTANDDIVYKNGENISKTFHFSNIQSISNVAASISNLPVGPCTIKITHSITGEILFVRQRTIRTKGRSVAQFFHASNDISGTPKWEVLQDEMNKNSVEEATVTVCSLSTYEADNSRREKLWSESTEQSKETVLKIAKRFLKRNNYIVPCSSSKIELESINVENKQISDLEFDAQLRHHRLEIINRVNNSNMHFRMGNEIVPQQEVNFKKTIQASKLYSPGRLYTASQSVNWLGEESDKVYIISALFGIIKAKDYLPWYDLAMNDKIDYDFVPIDFWEGKLDIIIQEIVASKRVLIDLLSDNYRDVLSEQARNMLTDSGIIFTSNDRNNRPIIRGRWLRAHL